MFTLIHPLKLLTTMPPGPGPDCLVDVGLVLVDAAGALGKAGKGVLQSRAAPFSNVWLGGIRGLANDGGHADGEGDQGEEGPHDGDDELLCLKQN